MAQCNLSFEKIFAPSRDPSPTMPFWDKMRLLYHGRLTVIAKQYTVLLHASLDPYNSTEEMELTWNNCGIIWTNAKMIFKGELNVIYDTLALHRTQSYQFSAFRFAFGRHRGTTIVAYCIFPI